MIETEEWYKNEATFEKRIRFLIRDFEPQNKIFLWPKVISSSVRVPDVIVSKCIAYGHTFAIECKNHIPSPSDGQKEWDRYLSQIATLRRMADAGIIPAAVWPSNYKRIMALIDDNLIQNLRLAFKKEVNRVQKYQDERSS